MSIVSQGIVFKVRLDVEGAKADQQVLEKETEKSHEAARRSFGTGRREGGGGGLGTLGGMGGLSASQGFGKYAAAVAVAVVAGLAVEQTFEKYSADFWSTLEGLSQGTSLEEYFALTRKEAQRSPTGRWLSKTRIGIQSALPAGKATADILSDIAKLGGKAPGVGSIAGMYKEQYAIERSRAEMENLKSQINGQIQARALGQIAAEGVDAFRKRLNLW